jgi:ech hydrogenase subunit E
MARTIIPFGPQHPVLPEPVHLDLVVEDEKVIEARPSIGFIHRGLEKLAETKDYVEFVYVAERICGICSFIHGQTYCQAIETIMNIEVPPRALYLRTVWGELSRIHSHLLWLGLMADGMGFESLFMHSWRVREKGAQYHRSHHRRPRHLRLLQNRRRAARHHADTIKTFSTDLEGIEKDMRDITNVFSMTAR